MEKSICDERHRQIDYRLNMAEKRLDICEERLDRNELVNTRLEERLNNLISQLEQLCVVKFAFLNKYLQNSYNINKCSLLTRLPSRVMIK